MTKHNEIDRRIFMASLTSLGSSLNDQLTCDLPRPCLVKFAQKKLIKLYQIKKFFFFEDSNKRTKKNYESRKKR